MSDSVTYDPRDVNVVVGNAFLTGFAEGTFVSCEKNEDHYTPHVGAQGEVDRARNANSLGMITVTLKHTSPSNAHLNNLAKSLEMFPARVVDRNTPQAMVGGSQCWIVKPANLERGREITGQEWQIMCADYDVSIKE
jgi:hypothetical protein